MARPGGTTRDRRAPTRVVTVKKPQSMGGRGRGRGRGRGGSHSQGDRIFKSSSRGGRGRYQGGRGRGGRGKPQGRRGPKTKEQLDAEMDDYFLKGDEKTAQKKLNDDLDEYWKNKPAAEEQAPDEEAAAGAE